MSAPRVATAVLALSFFVSLSPGAALGQTVVVPDDYPTIQAALNSSPMRILVRNGIYVENLTMSPSVSHSISLEPLPHGWDGEFSPPSDAHPTIVGSVTLGPMVAAGSPMFFTGFHVTGQVTIGPPHVDIKVAECQIDGGIANQGEPAVLSIRGCIVHGGINASGWYGDMTGNTVLGGGITTRSSAVGCCMAVLDNYVVGPAPIGIRFSDGGTNGVITGNTITGCEKGIVVSLPSRTTVANNVVMDCAGNGFQATGSNEGDSLSFSGNAALRCGGNGFDVTGVGGLGIRANEADDCGGNGFRIQGGYSIVSPAIRVIVTDNRVLRAGSDGMALDGRLLLSRNIVGRSHDNGITATALEASIDHNTSYWNGRTGFNVSSTGGVSIANNIAYANQHEGLVWGGGPSVQLACNDWFANVGGATSGTAPGATDVFLDPLFCNVPQDDVHLATFSPLHDAPGCGLIGALDVGCSEPTGVSLPAARGPFLARPQPAKGAVRFEWAMRATPGELEVYDATGARRWHAKVAAGATGMDWRGAETGGNALPSGVYFARLTRGGAVETARVVIVR